MEDAKSLIVFKEIDTFPDLKGINSILQAGISFSIKDQAYDYFEWGEGWGAEWKVRTREGHVTVSLTWNKQHIYLVKVQINNVSVNVDSKECFTIAGSLLHFICHLLTYLHKELLKLKKNVSKTFCSWFQKTSYSKQVYIWQILYWWFQSIDIEHIYFCSFMVYDICWQGQPLIPVPIGPQRWLVMLFLEVWQSLWWR